MAKATATKVLTVIHAAPSKFRIVDGFRGRSAPVPEEDVIALADSLRTQGQLQPIKARPVAGTDEYETIFGNTRVRAAQLVANGYTNNDGKEVKADPDFKLRAEVGEFTDEEAFASNVVENAQRKQCSAIDNMYNQERLRTEFAMTDAAIARLYGQDNGWVNRLKGLQRLPQAYLDAIHNGSMSVSAGFLIADNKMSDIHEADAFDAIWKLLKDDNGDKDKGTRESASIGATDMANAIKEWRKQQKAAATPETPPTSDEPGASGEAGASGETGTGGEQGPTTDGTSATTKPAAIALTFKQVKDAFRMCSDNPRCPEKTKTFSNYFLQFAAGEMEPKAFIGEVMKLFGETLLPEPQQDSPPADSPPADPDAPVNDPPASEHTVEKPKGGRRVTRK